MGQLGFILSKRNIYQSIIQGYHEPIPEKSAGEKVKDLLSVRLIVSVLIIFVLLIAVVYYTWRVWRKK